MAAGLSRAWLLGLMAGLLSGCSAIDALQPPAVVDIVRTIDNKANITTQDYEQLKDIADLVFQQIRDIDPQIHPKLQLQSSTNFIDEIRQQTESGFGPDLIITDSETALALYRSRLIDPIQLSEQDRQDTPQSLLDLVTSKDGALAARPVNQFVQLACFNKERLPTAPRTLEDLKQSSNEATFGMAVQLKDLFWTADAFDASSALRAAMDLDSPSADQAHRETVTAWLR